MARVRKTNRGTYQVLQGRTVVKRFKSQKAASNFTRRRNKLARDRASLSKLEGRERVRKFSRTAGISRHDARRVIGFETKRLAKITRLRGEGLSQAQATKLQMLRDKRSAERRGIVKQDLRMLESRLRAFKFRRSK